MSNLDIKEFNIYRAVSTITKPIADSTHTISQIAFYVVEIISQGGQKAKATSYPSTIRLTLLKVR